MIPPKSDPQARARWHEALRLTTLGWELALPIFGGVLAGYYLDGWLETHPTYTLGLLMLGLSSSVYNLWQVIQRMDARQKRSADEKPRTPPP